MKEVYIDFRNNQRRYEQSRDTFLNATDISDYNKELVMRFCRDAALGKTLLSRARKRISVAQLNNYFWRLSILIRHVQKDLDKLEMEDMENFIEALENDQIYSKGSTFPNGRRHTHKRNYSANYKRSTKITIRKFYKWLWGRSKVFPELVEWIDTHDELLEIPALSESDVQKMIDYCNAPHQRAIIQVLFDSGVRPGELMNVRLRHVSRQSINPDDPNETCYVIRVPFSKTYARTIPLPIHRSSELLDVWLSRHRAVVKVMADGTLHAQDLESPLFPFTASTIATTLRKAGLRALKRHVNPTLIRHSSATFWANRLTHFQMCKRFGWSMTSKMPQRYIDRAGVNDMEVARLYSSTTESRG